MYFIDVSKSIELSNHSCRCYDFSSNDIVVAKWRDKMAKDIFFPLSKDHCWNEWE